MAWYTARKVLFIARGSAVDELREAILCSLTVGSCSRGLKEQWIRRTKIYAICRNG